MVADIVNDAKDLPLGVFMIILFSFAVAWVCKYLLIPVRDRHVMYMEAEERRRELEFNNKLEEAKAEAARTHELIDTLESLANHLVIIHNMLAEAKEERNQLRDSIKQQQP